MAEEAFFRFGTNAEETAAAIDRAMDRINASLSRANNGTALDPQRFAEASGGLRNVFDGIEKDVKERTARINDLLVRAGSEGWDKSRLREGLQREITGAFDELPSLMARQLSASPLAAAMHAPARSMANEFAQLYWAEFGDALRNNRKSAGDALKGVALTDGKLRGEFGFDSLLEGINDVPVDYLTTQQSITQGLINRVRAERALDDVLNGRMSKERAIESGLGPAMGQLMMEPGRIRFHSETGEAIGVNFTDAHDRLAKLTRDQSEAITINKRLTTEREALAAATERAARAEAFLANATNTTARFAGYRYDDGNGLFLKPNARGGADVVTDPLKLNDATDAWERHNREIDNAARLLSRYDEVRRVRGYAVLDDDVFSVSRDGTRAAQVTKGSYAELEILKERDNLRQKELESVTRLDELEARRTVREAQNNSGVLGGFLGRLHRGDQSVESTFGGQIASAAMFSAAYGSIFTVAAAVRDTVREVVDYQDSLTDLEVATRSTDTVTSDWVDTLSEMSRLSGANMGAALDTAARGVRAFGDVAGNTKEELHDIGEATNQAATQLALIASKDLRDATGDTISIGTAFGLEPDQLNQVVDAVANAKRAIGGDPAQIAQGLSLIAGSAQEAGFTLNEAASIISLVQARTDQSGQAIATRLTRIFQILAGGTGKNLARDLGVDIEGMNLKQQIEAFAEIYSAPDASEAIQNRIASALGGTANLRELLPLLEEQPRLQAAYASALNNTGQGTDEFNRKSQNLVGILKQLAGSIKNLQVAVAESGLAAPFGLLLRVIEPALQGLERMLNAYDQFTSQIPMLQELIALTAEFLLLSKAIGVVRERNLLFSGGLGGFGRRKGDGNSPADNLMALEMAAAAAGIKLTTAQRVAAENALTGTVVASTRSRAAAETIAAGRAAAMGAGRGETLGILGGGARSLLGFLGNPWVWGTGLALGGMWAFNKSQDIAAQRNSFRETRATVSTVASRTGGTAAELQQAVNDIDSTLGEVRKTNAEWFNGEAKASTEKFLKSQRDSIEAMAERVAAEEELAASQEKLTVFGNGAIETVNQLAEGIAALAGEGKDGVTRQRMFSEALAADPPPDNSRRLRPEALTAALANQIYGSLTSVVPENGVTLDRRQMLFNGVPVPYDESLLGQPGYTTNKMSFGQDEIIDNLLRNNSPADLQRAMLDEIEAMGKGPDSFFTPEEEQQIVQAGIAAVGWDKLPLQGLNIREQLFTILRGRGVDANGQPVIGTSAGMTPDAIERIEEAMRSGRAVENLFNGSGGLDNNQLQSLLTRSEDGQWLGINEHILQPSLESAEAVALRTGRSVEAVTESVQRQYVRDLKAITKRYDGEGEISEEWLNEVAIAEDDLREAVDDRLEQQRKAAQSVGGLNKREIRRIGRDFLAKRIDNAGTDVSMLIDIMEDADRASLAIVEKKLLDAARVAFASVQLTNQLIVPAINGFVGLFTQIAAYAQQVMNNPVIAQYLAFANALPQANVTADPFGGMAGGEGANTYDPKKDAEEKKKTAQEKANERADLIAAKAEAQAAKAGGGLAEGRAALIAARARLNAQKRGTTEWYQALAELYRAQDQMADAVANYKATLDRLDGDITDPVEDARDALRDAQRRLAMDRRSGAGRDVIAEDRLAVRESRAALEAERFNQRLSDWQTKEELDKISFQKYMSLLDRERDRLSKIKNRTRQQQEQLWEVERAIKEANSSMDAQFNLGNINTRGLVYRARRYAEELKTQSDAASAARAANQVNQSVSIQIDGADTAKVRRIIEDYVGAGTKVRAAAPRRRR